MLDLWIVLNALGCFGFYVISHFVLFRFSRAISVIQWLIKDLIVLALFNGGLSLVFAVTGRFDPCTGILGAFMSLVLYGILCFSYVICCVGPYETSVRLRIRLGRLSP